MTERNEFRDSGELYLTSWVTVWKMQLVTAIRGGALSSQEDKDLTENDGCRSCCFFVCVLWFANSYLMIKPKDDQEWPIMPRCLDDCGWVQKWSEMLVGRWIGGVTTVMSVIICIRRWTFDEFCWGITVQPSKDGDWLMDVSGWVSARFYPKRWWQVGFPERFTKMLELVIWTQIP